MNDQLRRIMDDGIARLIETKKQADEAFARAKRDMGTLVEFAEQLPQKMLDKCSNIFVGELNFYAGGCFQERQASVNIGGAEERFIPYDGSKKLEPMKGKYRVIVVLQKME